MWGKCSKESIKTRIKLVSLYLFKKFHTNNTRPLVRSCKPLSNLQRQVRSRLDKQMNSNYHSEIVFLLTRPSGPGQSWSRHVRVSVCLCHRVQFFWRGLLHIPPNMTYGVPKKLNENVWILHLALSGLEVYESIFFF